MFPGSVYPEDHAGEKPIILEIILSELI